MILIEDLLIEPFPEYATHHYITIAFLDEMRTMFAYRNTIYTWEISPLEGVSIHANAHQKLHTILHHPVEQRRHETTSSRVICAAQVATQGKNKFRLI